MSKTLAANRTEIKCPKCDGPITLKTIATSGELGKPESETWLWGTQEEREVWEKGKDSPYRAILCRAGDWYHIRVGNNSKILVYVPPTKREYSEK